MVPLNVRHAWAMRRNVLWSAMLMLGTSCRFDLPTCLFDEDCGDHEFCDAQSTPRMCECVAGYARGLSGCEWTGVVTDPGFTAPAAWDALSFAQIDGTTLEPEMIDRGFGRLPKTACAAELQQRIVMPRVSRSEPLVASITYRVPDPVGAMSVPEFGMGTAWSAFPSTPFVSQNWTTVRHCLGVGHYAAATSTGRGEEIVLRLGQGYLCDYESVDIDRIEIVPALAGECTVPGQIENGEADEDNGWRFMSADGGSAGFVDGLGENGSRAGHLVVSQRCSHASAEIPVSPGTVEDIGSPWLTYYVSVSGAATVNIRFGGYYIGSLKANSPTRVGFCIPAPLRNVANNLSIDVRSAGYSNGGSCADLFNGSVIFDSIRLEKSSECGVDSSIADPGFESGALFQVVTSGTSLAQSVVSSEAHSGRRMLNLSLSSCDSEMYVYIPVTVPQPKSGHGSALTFWSRMPEAAAGAKSTLNVVAESIAVFPIAYDTQWRQRKLCLSPKTANRNIRVYFLVRASCTGTFPVENILIDDLAMTSDPACPAL
jgi:hypothetical protein